MARFVAVIVVALCAAGVAAANVGSAQVSSNWSGYVAAAAAGAPALTFTDATGSWRIPKVNCTRKGTSAAFWVGIGGSSDVSPALEQLGTSADCNLNGRPTYRAWTEIVPAPARFLTLKVLPGDRMTAAVAVDGQTVTMSIKNATRGTHYSTRVTVKGIVDTSSAEWIAEAPSLCRTQTACTIVPLSDFGTVGFTNAAATANGHTGTLLDPTWETTPVALLTSSGATRYTASSNSAGAVPTQVTTGGRAFSVTFRSSLSGAVPPSPLPGAPLPSFIH